MDYKELATFIIEAVGGEANIVSLTHCATRLRFALKDDNIPDEKKIKEKKGVLGVSVNGGQYQIIIGNTVPKVSAAIMEQQHWLAVALRTKKDKELRQMSFSAGLTAVLRITEPAMFGVTLKVKKVLPCVMRCL